MSTFFEKKLKKVFSGMLIMIITCCFFVINASAETIVLTEEKKLFGSPDISTASFARSVDVDELSDYLTAELIKCPESVDISSFNLEYTDTNVKILSNIIYYESPELFHIQKYSISISGGILIRIIPKYEYSAQEYTKMYNDCLKQTNIILNGIKGNSNLNDVQKALLIHDRLAVHCEYDVSNYKNNSIPSDSYTMYGTLVKGVSVCQGYAETYMYLLDKVGIESRLCSSDALFHAWNIVTINGKEYHVDVTWDDPVYDKTGYVSHDNFMRSSDGIYETDHTAYDYDTTPTDKTYDNYFWQSSTAAFQLVDNEIYYIDNDQGTLNKYSNKSAVCSLTDRWPASASGSYWVGNFSSLATDGTYLYYNLSEAVYQYDIKTNSSEKIWSPNLSEGELFRIYGFTYKDGYLICDVFNSPLFELNTKEKYQQKYLYHDISDSEIVSISVASAPNLTEYYIGDTLNTDGLCINLNYKNGLTDFISTGFTVSGFDSSSAGSKKVTVSYDGFTASFNVNIKTPSVVIDSSNIKIELKDFCILSAKTAPSNVSVKWSSSNTDVATVLNGEVEAISPGSAVITAEFTYNGNTYKDTCIVTVECYHSKTVTVAGKSATCTETGLTDGKKCSACGTVTVLQQTIAKKGHSEVTVAGKSATCTETGLTDGKKCSVCGTVTVSQQTIAKKGHTEVTVKGKSATCTETGLTDGKKCSACGTVTVAQRTIAKKSHTEITVRGKSATCTQDGLTDGKKCSVCGTVIVAQRTIAKNGHSEVTVRGKAATCTQDGFTDGKKCSACGTVTVAQRTIAKNGHSEVTVRGKAATCTQDGLTDGKKCSACGTVTVSQRTIAKKSHTEIAVKGKAATCTETGLTDGKKCLVCGEILKYQDVIPVKSHNYSDWVIEKPATTENEGLKVKICMDCGLKQSEIIPQLSESTDDPIEPDVMIADANGDNKINAADARIILRMASKLESYSDTEIAYLDINGDKKITAADARIVLRISAKLDSIENYI